MKRSIRLKEHRIGLNDFVEPSAEYLSRTDGTLEARPYRRVSTPDGFLSTGVPIEWERPSIFVLGGSFVEGMYAEEDRRFVAQLARTFPQNVINSGYSGMTTLQLVSALLNKIVGLSKPGDTVLAAVPLSDVNPLLGSQGYWTSNKTYTPIVPGFASNRPGSISDLASLLHILSSVCISFEIDLQLIVCPHRKSDFSREAWVRLLYRRDRARFERARDKAYEIIDTARTVAADLSLKTIDLHEEFHHQGEFFYDELHLNHLGHDAVADFISRKLRV